MAWEKGMYLHQDMMDRIYNFYLSKFPESP